MTDKQSFRDSFKKIGIENIHYNNKQLTYGKKITCIHLD